MPAAGPPDRTGEQDVSVFPTREPGAPRGDVTIDQLLALSATWFNLEAFMHRLWGQARAGTYSKQEWAAFHQLLQRVRARTV
jgi:hypothetical protein